MPGPTPIPEAFRVGPFRRDAFVDAGHSEKMLRGKRFQRIFPNVWAVAGELTHAQRMEAAAMALPGRARLSHLSRIQALGLDIGDQDLIHFTVQGDHHIDTDGIFLHRTEVMPPTDAAGVTPAAAFVQCCADLRLIDLIVIGDWLLGNGHMTIEEVGHVATLHPWRPGAAEVVAVLPWLDARSRSPRESELRVLVVACGLPEPEVNAPVFDARGRKIATVDLLIRKWMLALEYEGRQHAEDPRQFAIDIDRYAKVRHAGVDYLQVVAAHLASPRAAMVQVHQRLVARGYDGPPPDFGRRWLSLFERVQASRPRRGR